MRRTWMPISILLIAALLASTIVLAALYATKPTKSEMLAGLTPAEAATMSALAPVLAFSPEDVPGEVGGEPFIDDLGREVFVPGASSVESIVCLHPAATETVFYLGAGDKLVAVSNAWTGDPWAEYPGGPGEYESWITTPEEVDNEIEQRVWDVKDLAAIPAAVRVTPDAPYTLNPEVTLSPQNIDGDPLLEGYPDVVFVFSDTIEYAAGIEELVPVIVFFPLSLEDVLYDMTVIGKIVGKEAEVANLIEEIKADLLDITMTTLIEPRPKVFLETGYYWGTIYTTGSGSIVSSLIYLAGGDDIGTAVSSGAPSISPEYIVYEAPDIIILAHLFDTPDGVAGRPGWYTIPAVVIWQADPDEGIYQLTVEEMDQITRPGPRIVAGLMVLLGIIHPELS
jgi:ABC-type Fe3+-hydroxamate transport system substrate-binding protein